ncbi:MAG: hypothetical protein V7637_5258 [Mycobacteriales bacterium]
MPCARVSGRGAVLDRRDRACWSWRMRVTLCLTTRRHVDFGRVSSSIRNR